MVPGIAELRKVAIERTLPLPAPRVCRAIREAAGVSQEELGRVLGVSGVTICRYEGGSREPRGARRRRYLEALEELRRV